MSVLKELLGEEMRKLIREELKTVAAGSPGALSSAFPAGELATVMDAKSDVEHSAGVDVFVRADEPERQTGASKERHSNGVSSQQTHRSATMTTDIAKTADYMHDLAMAKKMESMSSQLDAKREAREMAKRFPRFEKSIYRIYRITGKMGNVQAPHREDSLSKIADSLWFHVVVNVAILTNCAFLTHSADWLAKNYSSKPPLIWFYVDITYLAIFIVELFVRLWRYRSFYFFGAHMGSNWVDFIIVVSGILEIVVSQLTDATSLNFLRILRLARLLKVLRVIRVVKMFRTLRVIFQSLKATMVDLAWCSGMLAMIQFMFALVLVTRIGSYLREERETLSLDEVSELTQVFGSIRVAMLHLFSVSLGGEEWYGHYVLLIPTGMINEGVYLFFVLFSFIAVLNVMLGIFVEKAMKNLELTKEEKARQHAQEELKVQRDLLALCREADADGDGEISLAEWDKCLGRGKMTSFMDLIGFRSHDLRQFFQRLAARSEHGKVNLEVFVRGCMRLRGSASSFDVQHLIVELRALHECLQKADEMRHRDILNEHDYVRQQFERLKQCRVIATVGE